MELQPLLDTLAKVSDGRVLPHADLVVDKTLSIAKIPITGHNTADKTDVALRRYSADWLRTNLKNVNVQTAFEEVTGLSWWEGEKEIPIIGILVISWWPRPELTEHEQLIARQRANRRGGVDNE